MLKVRTLFSGIGSPEIALRDLQIPFELIDFCEVDKYAVKSYCAVHGVSQDRNLGDITKVWGRNLPYADLLVWGFPCTDISVAGKQKGIIEGETRSGLYYEGLRILKETKPKYSIIENVKNLTGKKFKAEFEQMLKDIDEIGYNNYWEVLNAKDYGIPQNRERVFVVSIRKDIDTHTFNFPQGFDNGLRLKDFLEDEVDEKYYINRPWHMSSELDEKHDVNEIAQLEGINYKTTRSITDINKICRCLDTMGGGQREPKILCLGNVNPSGRGMNGNVFSIEGLSPTLTTNKGEGIKISDEPNYRVRKLSPKECWRLMGFKDEDFQKAVDAEVSNSQLYKQAGNSIVSNVLFYIFKNLLQTEITALYEEEKELS